MLQAAAGGGACPQSVSIFFFIVVNIFLSPYCVCARLVVALPDSFLSSASTTVLDVEGAGPLKALDRLQAAVPADAEGLQEWRQKARLAAILGSCPKSIASLRSGVRHWQRFINIAYGDSAAAFPPKLASVLEWSNTFRCLATFCNYLGYLRTYCCAMDCVPPPYGHPALRRAMGAIAKRQLFTPRLIVDVFLVLCANVDLIFRLPGQRCFCRGR